MKTVVLNSDLAERVRPRAGRVLLKVPPNPKFVNFLVPAGASITVSLEIPESARDYKLSDTHQKALVLKVGYGEFWEEGKLYPGVTADDFGPGQWVVFRPLLEELNQLYVLTDVRRVDAIIETV